MNNLLWVTDAFIRLASGSNNLDRLLRDFARVIESTGSYGVLGFLNTPPDNPKEKDKYIVGSTPDGAWTGKADNIALWDAENRLWRFTKPVYGMMMVSDGAIYLYLDDGWEKLDIGGSTTLDELQAHINDAVRHITAEERTDWNNKVSKTGDMMTGLLTFNLNDGGSIGFSVTGNAGESRRRALINMQRNDSAIMLPMSMEYCLMGAPVQSVSLLKHPYNDGANNLISNTTGLFSGCTAYDDGSIRAAYSWSGVRQAAGLILDYAYNGVGAVQAPLTDSGGTVTIASGDVIPDTNWVPYLATQPHHLITKQYLDNQNYPKNESSAAVQLAATGCSATYQESNAPYAAFLGARDCDWRGVYGACIASIKSGTVGPTGTLGVNHSAVIAAVNCAVGSLDPSPTVGMNCILVTGRNTINPTGLTLAGGFSEAGTSANPVDESEWASLRSTTNRKIELNFATGNITATGQFTGGATFTDYAEYFENKTPGVIPLGTIVSLDGRFVRRAQSGDDILGVVSATGVMTAGNTPFTWARRYMTGEFGETLYHDIPDPDWQAKIPDPNWQAKIPANTVTPTIPDPAYTGDNPAECPMIDNPDTTLIDNPVPQGVIDNPTPQGTITVPLENPEFDINQTNIPRSSRPEEWTCVGLLGQVHVRVDATVQVEDWVMPVDGIGTKSEKRTPLKCMEIRQPFDAEKGYGVAFCLLK